MEVSSSSEKPIIRRSPYISGSFPTLPLKQSRCSSDWWWPSPVLSVKIVERFLFPRLSPPHCWWRDAGFKSNALSWHQYHCYSAMLTFSWCVIGDNCTLCMLALSQMHCLHTSINEHAIWLYNQHDHLQFWTLQLQDTSITDLSSSGHLYYTITRQIITGFFSLLFLPRAVNYSSQH